MKMKLFTAGAAMVPAEWMRAIDTHRVQADVVIIAASKAAAIDLLAGAGLSRGSAEGIVTQTRMERTGHYSTPVRDLVDVGIVDLATPGAYVYPHYVKDSRVARVDVEGLPIVGHFRYRENRVAQASGLPYGMYAEAVAR